MLKHLASLCLTLAMISGAFGCKQKASGPTSPATSLTVFAAASLTESYRDIGKRFEAAHPGVSITFNFAGSQQLREQLSQGAPADVFASANLKEMDAAKGASLVDPATVKTFARNRLVVIVPKPNPAHVTTLIDLGKTGVRLDVADPSVPVGKYTMQMLDKLEKDAAFGPPFKKATLANVVSREENVKSVVSKVRLGEADAGVVYVTDVTPEAARDVTPIDVPDAFNQVADYPIAVTAKPQQADSARQFVDFVLSSDGQQILHGYGFLPPDPATKP